MRSNSKRKNSSQLPETPRSNQHRIKEKQKLSEDIKAKYIQQLEERNRKLKYEIIKITEMLQQQSEKPQKKEHRLIPNESSAEVVKKQLENVYKQIKNYQKQIRNLEAKQSGGMLTDKMSRLENIYNQKAAHLEKLKAQLSTLTKVSLDNSKKLKNNAGKQQLENQMLKYNQEIKLLRQKVRQAEARQKKKMENAKKQFDYIKKLEKKLIEDGVSIDQLEEMKRNNLFNQIYEKIANGGVAASRVQGLPPTQKKQQMKEQKQQIEEATLDRYNELKNQIKLYKKLHVDYDKRLQALEKEKVAQQKATQQTKAKLQIKQQEVAKLQAQVAQLKSKIKKTNMKPSVSSKTPGSQENVKRRHDKVKVNMPQKPKIPPNNSATDQTHLKYDEKGFITDKGARFTDRTVLGKNFNARIVGLRVWTEKSTFQIAGIQCIYKIGQQIRDGAEYIAKQCKNLCTENLMQVPDGDYIKSISGNLSQNNIVQYLVVISKDSQISRFGVVKPTQKQFNFDIEDEQIPVCMYGSLRMPETKKQCSTIQQLGFQITRDKGFSKDDKFI